MLSTKEIHRHTPPWRKDDGAPVFLLRAGSVIDRAMVEAELAGEHQAGRIFAFEFLEAFRQGVTALGSADDAAYLIGLAEAEAALEGSEALPEGEAKTLAEARVELGKYWPDYRALLAQQARRLEIAPIIALRRFCTGWENVAAPFVRGPDGLLSLDALARLDPLDMRSAGSAAYGLLYPKDLAGNSPQPSQSDESLPLSTADEPSKKDGKSTGKDGRKTPASSSPSGSGASSTSG